MSNRFHNKFHRFNHSTSKDVTIPDAGYDPIASHEYPFKGDFVQYPDGAVLSARNIATNMVIPFSGNVINFPYPYTVIISNLSAVSATINYQDILVSELSGFVISGADNTLQIHPIHIEGVNNLTLKGTPISSTSWVSISGDFQTQSNMYVSGVAYIANEYVTNLTALNLSGYNVNTYNLTGVNNVFTYETVANSNITNLTASNVTVSDCLSTNCISPFTSGANISAHGNIDMRGYSISGIGNTSLTFQSGQTINSDKVIKWDSTYTTVCAISAGLRTDINTVSSNLNILNNKFTPIQTTVQTHSANWDSAYASTTGLNLNYARLDGSNTPFTSDITINGNLKVQTLEIDAAGIYNGNVTATGSFLTLLINGSALAIPLYSYLTGGIGFMAIGSTFVVG